ncbi:MAG: MFS transporter [Verrucomicrobiota bacterium]|jgi:GPH family glycoside/pentoside/hexuronide:cation symporter
MSGEIQKLPLREKIGYGFGDLASVLFWQTIMVYLLYFYTDVFGLTAKAAGVMFFVSRILDAFFDVVIGMTADRTKSRWGKFRPYILWGAVPLAVSAVLAFSTPSFADTGKLVYAYITFISFMFLYSTVNIPYTALLGVISGDPIERADAATSKFIGAFSAGIIVSATALPLAKYFGEGNDAKGWHMTMIIYGAAAVVFLLVTFLSVRERVQPIAKERTNVASDLHDLSLNVPWILLFIVTILFILFVCIRMNVTTHYFKYYIGEQQVTLFGKTHKYGFEVLASAFNTVGQLLSLIGLAMIPLFARYLGRKKAAIILFVTALVCTGAFYFFKPENLLLIFVFQAVGSLTGGPISALLWIMYADTADYSEWKTGRRATGLVFSASIMSNKLGWAVGSMIAAFILAKTGFVANVAQNIGVLNGLKEMMSIIPVAIGTVALIILVFFYKLDEETMIKVKAGLDERRKAAGDATPAA